MNDTANQAQRSESSNDLHHQIDMNFIRNTNGFKIMSWNVRSMLKKMSEIEACITKIQPDVVCLVETWLNNSTAVSAISIPSYNLFRMDRHTRGGGLCIFINNKLDCDVDKYSHLNVCNSDIELCVLQIQLPQSKPFVFITCYRPPQGNIDDALSSIKLASTAIPSCAELFIVGDINIDYSKAKSPSCTKLKSFECSTQLKQYIKTPTRITDKGSTLIDHIYSSSPHLICGGTLNINLIDHLPCFVFRKKAKYAGTSGMKTE